MLLTLSDNKLIVERTPEDKRIYKESTLFHYIKEAIRIQLGLDVIKKRMTDDGHLFGDDALPYIRERKPSKSGKRLAFYDSRWEVRNACKAFNEGLLTLNVTRI